MVLSSSALVDPRSVLTAVTSPLTSPILVLAVEACCCTSVIWDCTCACCLACASVNCFASWSACACASCLAWPAAWLACWRAASNSSFKVSRLRRCDAVVAEDGLLQAVISASMAWLDGAVFGAGGLQAIPQGNVGNQQGDQAAGHQCGLHARATRRGYIRRAAHKSLLLKGGNPIHYRLLRNDLRFRVQRETMAGQGTPPPRRIATG
jgi:hypothetical protein